MSDPQGSTLPSIAVVEPFGYGTMVHVVHMLCNAFAAAGHDVTLITAADYELAQLPRRYSLVGHFTIDRPDLRGTLPRGAVQRRLRLFYLRLLRLTFVPRFWWQYARVVAIIRQRRPTFVVVNTVFRYPLISLFLKRIRDSGTRVVQLCHEFQMREATPTISSRLLHLTNRRVYQLFDTILLFSTSQQQQFLEANSDIPAQRTAVVPMGNGELFRDLAEPFAIRKVLGLGSATRIVLFFGRVRPEKGIEDLVEAFARVCSQLTDLHLIVSGHAAPTYLAKLQGRVRALGLEKHVTMLPEYVPSAQVWPLMRDATVAVFPYRSASQSASMQVALSCGRPVIATRAGGLSEVIVHGENGLLVTPQQPAELADAMLRLLQDDAYAAQIGQRGQRLAQTVHSWENVAAEMLRVLQPDQQHA